MIKILSLHFIPLTISNATKRLSFQSLPNFQIGHNEEMTENSYSPPPAASLRTPPCKEGESSYSNSILEYKLTL